MKKTLITLCAAAVLLAVNIPTASAAYAANGAAIYSSQAGTQYSASVEQTVISLVNEIRAEHGLPSLAHNAQLTAAARRKCLDMANRDYFSHNSPTYGSPFQMMRSFGITYRSAGENIARGYSTAHAVVQAWMLSPGHRANILSKTYTQIGVGYTSEGHHWTQLFIG